jgi:predicted secreted acid phosphatase
MDGAIGDTVDDFNDRFAGDPAKERDAAAFRAEIDGDACLFGHGVG